MKVVPLIPSRGLLSSLMAESLFKELRGYNFGAPLFCHDKPIPDCFNDLTSRFLEDPTNTHAWFIEEDIVLPQDSLNMLISQDTDIAFLDYPLIKFKGRQCYGMMGTSVVWVGLGCTLVHRRVFEKVGEPWFLGGYRLAFIFRGSESKMWELTLMKENCEYGGQDTYFCGKAFLAGCKMSVVPDIQCGHEEMKFDPYLWKQIHYEAPSQSQSRQ